MRVRQTGHALFDRFKLSKYQSDRLVNSSRKRFGFNPGMAAGQALEVSQQPEPLAVSYRYQCRRHLRRDWPGLSGPAHDATV